jgi:tetraacyldisaccharide 4'-kinase
LRPRALTCDGKRIPLEALASKPVVALAAIARPEAFFEMLRARGLTLAQTIALPDHDNFDGWQRPSGTAHTLVCTEKDAVKLWRHAPDALAVPLHFAPSPEFSPRSTQSYHRSMDTKLLELLVCPVTKAR